ncbi:MAG: class I SAM-dependent methyltransferase [Terriglobia bacterium]
MLGDALSKTETGVFGRRYDIQEVNAGRIAAQGDERRSRLKLNMSKPQTEKITFSFGRNWQAFVERYLNPERERIAADSLKEFMEVENFHGRSFLDLGCGSGLFSLAAYRLGARRITSLDVDPFSVHCCEELRRRAGNPAHWEIHEGSVLNGSFLISIPKADVVYAWGSLHHTGNMWQAIRNAAGRV